MKSINIVVALALMIPSVGTLSACANGNEGMTARRPIQERRQERYQQQQAQQQQPQQQQAQQQQPQQQARTEYGEREIQPREQGEFQPEAKSPYACPTFAQDVDVDAVDTQDGVALTFVTQDGDVEQLRERAEVMAKMYEAHADSGHMGWQQMRGEDEKDEKDKKDKKHKKMHGKMGGDGPMPVADAKVDEIENGARIELTPSDPGKLDELRAQARWHAERMDSGQCWIVGQATQQSPS